MLRMERALEGHGLRERPAFVLFEVPRRRADVGKESLDRRVVRQELPVEVPRVPLQQDVADVEDDGVGSGVVHVALVSRCGIAGGRARFVRTSRCYPSVAGRLTLPVIDRKERQGSEMMMRIMASCLALLLGSGTLAAQQARSPGAALVLIPGAGGAVPNDFLVQSLPVFQAAGLEAELVGGAGEAASAVAAKQARGLRVTLVGMSFGAVTVAQALARGARPDAVVFAAGGLFPPGTPNGSVVETLGDPALLPRTLVLHHREDACRFTPPEAVPGFVRWARGRARVQWIDGGGGPGLPCRPNTPHTFTGRTEAAAGAIVRFARAR